MKFLSLLITLIFGMISEGTAERKRVYMQLNEETTFTVPFVKRKSLSEIEALIENEKILAISIESYDDGVNSIIIRVRALQMGESRVIIAFRQKDPRRFWCKRFIISE